MTRASFALAIALALGCNAPQVPPHMVGPLSMWRYGLAPRKWRSTSRRRWP